MDSIVSRITPVARTKARLDAALDDADRSAENVTSNERIAAFVRKLDSLSPRQMQLLGHVFAGALNKTIADRLGIDVRTVETHRARMMDKLDARSLVDLIRMVERCRRELNEN